jgi:NAD(P)-dependent dehydrogenase (short-subunit alcohol dehydrogenase family)
MSGLRGRGTQIEGRTAFVTGGANGVGLGLARALLAAGCKVAIADVRQESLDRAAAQLDNMDLLGIRFDVTSREDFAAAAAEVEAALGPVSLLFNNAGVNLFQTIEESSYDDWDWILGVNLHGTINGVVTFVPRMLAAGNGGHVVNTASMAAFLAGPIAGIYNCSKFAVRGLSESLRYSLAPHGIGVSVLCPGLVNSYIYASDEIRPAALRAHAKPADPDFVAQLANVHQAGMSPDEVAAKVLDGVRADRFYIFSHPEHKDELREVFDEILADYPDGETPPDRLKVELERRQRYREARRAAGVPASR